MSAPAASPRWDVVVVGSGPGGAAVARRLAAAGKRVVILERGRDWRGHRLYGTYPGALLYADRRALLFTDQGLNVIRPLMLGGATSMYCGCAAEPPPWLSTAVGEDLEPRAARLAAELEVAPLPAELRGAASTRVAEAGRALGMAWEPQAKFMRPARARPFRCGARCMLGCRCGAKWNAAEWVDEAVAAGATLRTRARVERVLVEDGAAVGVVGRHRGRPFQLRADRVVLAAGGIGSALVLRRSGFEEAGRGMAMDTTLMVYGVSPEDGMGADPPMTWSAPDPELDVLYSTLVDPWLMFPIMMAVQRPADVLRWPRWGRMLGVMIKVRDEVSGEVRRDGGLSKGLTTGERERLAEAEVRARRILREAGCREDSLLRTPLRGTHPSATVRIGTLVDAQLSTPIPGLHVCDASVFPAALGRPTVLAILALGDRLAERLLAPGSTGGPGG